MTPTINPINLSLVLSIAAIICSLAAAKPSINSVEEVDKTQVDSKKPHPPDTQTHGSGLAKREVSNNNNFDYSSWQVDPNALLLDEQKRSRDTPSRNPYSWMVKEEDKRARNPYSWLAAPNSNSEVEDDSSVWRKLLPKRQMMVGGPLNWIEGSAKRGNAAGVRNPYSWMNFT